MSVPVVRKGFAGAKIVKKALDEDGEGALERVVHSGQVVSKSDSINFGNKRDSRTLYGISVAKKQEIETMVKKTRNKLKSVFKSVEFSDPI